MLRTRFIRLCKTTTAGTTTQQQQQQQQKQRFVSPWAASGIDPSNVHTSANPILRQRRDNTRFEEFRADAEARDAEENTVTRDKEIRAKSEERLKDFQQRRGLGGGGGGGGGEARSSMGMMMMGAGHAAAAAPHSDEHIATIKSGTFAHMENYRQQAKAAAAAAGDASGISSTTAAHVNVDLDNFLPLPFDEVQRLFFSSSQQQDEGHSGEGTTTTTTTTATATRKTQKWPYGGKVGFAIDVDGVLIRGSAAVGVQAIEGASEALHFLREAKIPFVLMTNGGGYTENAWAARVSKVLKLDPPLTETQVMVSHTPMKALANKSVFAAEEENGDFPDNNSSNSDSPLAEKPVLVVGGGSRGFEGAIEVMKSYGFKYPMHVQEFQREHPQFVPLKAWPPHEQDIVKSSLRRIRKHAGNKKVAGEDDGDGDGGDDAHQQQQGDILAGEAAEKYPQFAAVFVLGAGGIDVFNDFQVMLDVLLGVPDGQPGGPVTAPRQTIPVYYAAEDLFWAGPTKLPRLGFGAIKDMFSSAFETVTGEPLDTITYGKPRQIAYLCAQDLLKEQNKVLGWGDDHAPELICMVGDNIETDIMGANAMNSRGASASASRHHQERTKAGGQHDDDGGGKKDDDAVDKKPTEPSWLSVHVMTGIGHAPPALRSVPEGDTELQWLLQHYSDPVPHYVAPTFRHFVGELAHFSEEQIRQMQTFKHVLPNPVDVETLYNWKK